MSEEMVVKEIVIEKTEIHLEQRKRSGTGYRRTAIIYLIHKRFDRCEYNLDNALKYTLEDWEFLNMVSKKILEVAQNE